MLSIPSLRSAPQDIPTRAHEPWTEEEDDTPYFGIDDSLESGPSTYLQTPPSSSIPFLLSPPQDAFHSALKPAQPESYLLNNHLATLSVQPSPTPSQPVIDLLTAGVGELAHALDSRELTSVRAIKMYLAQIERLNGYLHALTYVAARETLLEQARECDRIIRSEGFNRRSLPLCGIPVVVK